MGGLGLLRQLEIPVPAAAPLRVRRPGSGVAVLGCTGPFTCRCPSHCGVWSLSVDASLPSSELERVSGEAGLWGGGGGGGVKLCGPPESLAVGVCQADWGRRWEWSSTACVFSSHLCLRAAFPDSLCHPIFLLRGITCASAGAMAMFCLAWHLGWKALVAEMAVDSVVGLRCRHFVSAQSLLDGWD